MAAWCAGDGLEIGGGEGEVGVGGDGQAQGLGGPARVGGSLRPAVPRGRVEQGPGPRQVATATGDRRLTDHGVGRLTRLPPPHRAHPSIVHAFITERFTEPFLTLSQTGYQELLATIAAGQILGGPAYDALIAFTAVEHQAALLSLDQRATATYEAVGATVEQLAP